jgi:Skp family chaperone for outer membrane proteins
MKLAFLSLLCAAASCVSANAQDPKPSAPPSPDRPAPGPPDAALRERFEREQQAFREKMQQKTEAAMKEAAALEADGKLDKANDLRAQAKQNLEAAIKEHQTATQKKMQALARGDAPNPQHPKNRLHHAEQAINHLREAGLPDLAEQVARAAERLRQPQPEPRRWDGDIDALRRELNELRETVRALKESQSRETKRPTDEH